MSNTPHFIWGGVVAVAIASIFGSIMLQVQRNYDFDRVCVQSGKSIVWETKQGADAPYKECK